MEKHLQQGSGHILGCWWDSLRLFSFTNVAPYLKRQSSSYLSSATEQRYFKDDCIHNVYLMHHDGTMHLKNSRVSFSQHNIFHSVWTYSFPIGSSIGTEVLIWMFSSLIGLIVAPTELRYLILCVVWDAVWESYLVLALKFKRSE